MLEYRDAKSQKFWEIVLSGSEFTVRYGRIGAAGTSKTKTFPSDAAATKEANKQLTAKVKKGYAAIELDGADGVVPAAPAPRSKAKPKPKAPAATNDAVEVDADGVRWVLAAAGYRLALIDGKLAARNAKGKRLKAPSKAHKTSELGAQMLAAKDWLAEHERECLLTVESWMLRSLPVPRKAISSVWPDAHWQRYLKGTIVGPVDGDEEEVGFLTDVKDGKLGIVNLDGESIWIDAESVAIPHPVLLEDLEDWRELMTDLSIEQGLLQLMRQTFERPKTPGKDNAITDYNDATFDPLGTAIRKAWSMGFRVRGGYATCIVWEDQRRLDACYWIGAEDPQYESCSGDLIWMDSEQNVLPVASVGPVAYSEGLRLATAIYGVRKVEEVKEDDA